MLVRRRLRVVIVALVGVLVAATALFPSAASAAGSGPSFLRFGTWDTALRPWLATPDRQQAVNDVIADSGQDVLALQGVWGDSARNAILDDPRIAAKYPHSYWVPASQVFAYCSIDLPRSQLEDILTGIIQSGTDPRFAVQPQTPIDPGVGFLNVQFAYLGGQLCLEAVFAGVQDLPADASPYDILDRAYFDGSVKYVQGGDTGLLVLSDQPFTDVSIYQPDTFLQRAATLYATVDGMRVAFADWPHNVFETTAPGTGFLDTGAQQPDFAADLLAHNVDLVVGDLASGPDYQPAAFTSLTAGGLTPTYSGATHCPAASHTSYVLCANTSPFDLPANTSVDNILNAHPGRCWSSHAFATAPVSDHIGVSATCANQTDVTAPMITPSVSGTLGNNGWYTSDVGLSWTLTEPETEVTASSGCGPTTLTSDTTGQSVTCTATSPGGTSSGTVSIKRDATGPAVTVNGGPSDGGSYYSGAVPAAPTCTALDATSGVTPAGCSVSGYSSAIGPHTIGYSATDNAGNQTTVSRSYTVLADTSAPTSAVTTAPGPLRSGQKLVTVAGAATVKNTAGATVGTYSATCWNSRGTALTLSSTDVGSGVASLTYAATGSTVIAPTTTTTPPATVTIANAGLTTLAYAARDRAGNQEATRRQTVLVNTLLPFTCTGPTPSFTLPSHGSVTLVVTVNGKRVMTTFPF